MGISRQEYWSGLHALLQGIVPTQRLNLGLLYYRQIFYHLSHQGSHVDSAWWLLDLGREAAMDEGMATHSSILAWRFPWTEEPAGLQFKALIEGVIRRQVKLQVSLPGSPT